MVRQLRAISRARTRDPFDPGRRSFYRGECTFKVGLLLLRSMGYRLHRAQHCDGMTESGVKYRVAPARQPRP